MIGGRRLFESRFPLQGLKLLAGEFFLGGKSNGRRDDPVVERPNQ